MQLNGENRKTVTDQAQLLYIEGCDVRINAITVDEKMKEKIRKFIQAEILPYEKGLYPADMIVIESGSTLLESYNGSVNP